MKRTIITLAALAAFATASAESIKLSINQVYGLVGQRAPTKEEPAGFRGALLKLDDPISIIIKQPADAEGNEPAPREVRTAYDFPAATRLAIYRNRRALEEQLGDFDKGRIALVKRTWGDRDPATATEAERTKFFKELADLSAAEVKVEITRLKPEDLYKNGNPIPSDVLMALQPILAEEKK